MFIKNLFSELKLETLMFFVVFSNYVFIFTWKVLVPKDPLLMGKMVEVNIYEAGKHYMKGRPVSDARVYTASITRPLAKGEVSGLTEVSKRHFLLYYTGKTAAVQA